MTNRPTLDAPDDDPWLWLEDVEGERATGWADAQTATTLARFGGGSYQADRDALRTLLDRPDNLPVPGRRDGLLYNYWRDAANPARPLAPAPRWSLTAPMRRIGTSCSTWMRSRRRRARIGSGRVPARCRLTMTAPSSASRPAGAMRWRCGNSISSPGVS